MQFEGAVIQGAHPSRKDVEDMVDNDETKQHVYAIELAGLQLHRWVLLTDDREKVLRVAREWRERLGADVNVAYKAPGESAAYIDF